MSDTEFLTLIILILLFVILGGTWLFLRRIVKNLRRISSDIQNTIDKLQEWNRPGPEQGD